MTTPFRIQTFSVLPVVGPELTERLNQELASLYSTSVEPSSFDSEPPAAGMTEIAFTIIASGALGLMYKFFEPLVTAAGEAYRDEVLRLIRHGRRSPSSGRGYVPLRIGIGETSSDLGPHFPVRYYLHLKLDEAELLRQLKAADEHVLDPIRVLLGIRRAP